MIFTWIDYNPETMGYVENWLDEHAVRMTGMDDGFRQEYEYWSNEDCNTVGKNYWCKVVFENGIPFAVIEFGLCEGVITIMETFVAPEKRGQGMGSKAIKELIENAKVIIGIDIEKAEAIIYPSNIASQKAFEKAGFKYHHTHEDGDAMSYVYEINDKNQDKFIDIGTNKIEVFSDTAEEITQCINNSGLTLIEHYETEFANVFVCEKQMNNNNSGFMINFEYLNKSDISVYAQTIFDILSNNMTKIAPTGNTLEEDFRMWLSAVSSGLQRDERQIILIKDSENVVGFFQYYTNEDTFMMEEIQFKPEYQSKGIFRKLYGFVFKNIRNDLKFVKAYANICNKKSIGILGKLGLDNIGLNKNGHSYHFKGEFNSLVEWYEKRQKYIIER